MSSDMTGHGRLALAAGVLVAVVFWGYCAAPADAWWGDARSHGRMARAVLEHPTILPHVKAHGLSIDAIAREASMEPPKSYHHPGWSMLKVRGYFTEPKWKKLDNKTRILGYLIHIASDCGVGMNHSPARAVYIGDDMDELFFEGQMESWKKMPAIVPYEGTYAQKMAEFARDQRAVALWTKKNCARGFARLGDVADYNRAASGGARNGLRLSQVVVLEWFMANTAPAPGVSDSTGSAVLAADKRASAPNQVSSPDPTPRKVFGSWVELMLWGVPAMVLVLLMLRWRKL